MSTTQLVSDERMNATTGWGDDDGLKYVLDRYEIRDIYEAELQSLRQRISRMEEAATNVLSRWDSPNWEWDKHGHTAWLMADLRNAIAAKP